VAEGAFFLVALSCTSVSLTAGMSASSSSSCNAWMISAELIVLTFLLFPRSLALCVQRAHVSKEPNQNIGKSVYAVVR